MNNFQSNEVTAFMVIEVRRSWPGSLASSLPLASALRSSVVGESLWLCNIHLNGVLNQTVLCTILHWESDYNRALCY